MVPNLKNVEIVFQKLSEDGFDLKEPLKCGFFFFDINKKKLEKVFEELKNHKYKKEDLNKMDDGKWRLYVRLMFLGNLICILVHYNFFKNLAGQNFQINLWKK